MNKPFVRFVPSFGNVQSDSVSPREPDAAGPCGMEAFRTASSLSGAVSWRGRDGGTVTMTGALTWTATEPFKASSSLRMAEVFRLKSACGPRGPCL